MVTDENDLSAWYRADQESARAAYTAADTATLAALLPVLEREIELAKTALATWQRGLQDGQGFDAALEEQRNEVLQAFRSRADSDPTWKGVADEVSAGLRSAVDELRARSGDGGQRLVDVALVQALALTQRRHLVREELQRRGLLPGLPG